MASLELLGHYLVVLHKPSDINEHIHILQHYASECNHITECGMRTCTSSWAFLYGLAQTKTEQPKKFIGVDLDFHENILDLQRVSKELGIDFRFFIGNDLEINMEPTDLLFIDTWHVYGHLKRELEKMHPLVRKYIILHDTETDGELGESLRCNLNIKEQAEATGYSAEEISKGLKPALVEFLHQHPEFQVKQHFTFNNGLTVLERKY